MASRCLTTPPRLLGRGRFFLRYTRDMFHFPRTLLKGAAFAISLWVCAGYCQSSNDAEIERYSQEGQKALADARYPDAERAFEKLRSLEPDVPEVLYHNAKIFGNSAFLSVQKLAKIAPNSVWRHEAAGEAYESQGSYVQAIDQYQRVIAIDPHRLGVHYRLGRTWLARSRDAGSADDRKQAMKEFEKELELDSSNANAAYELGDMYRSSGQLNEAKDAFE